jgi:hypothetical protein
MDLLDNVDIIAAEMRTRTREVAPAGGFQCFQADGSILELTLRSKTTGRVWHVWTDAYTLTELSQSAVAA